MECSRGVVWAGPCRQVPWPVVAQDGPRAAPARDVPGPLTSPDARWPLLSRDEPSHPAPAFRPRWSGRSSLPPSSLPPSSLPPSSLPPSSVPAHGARRPLSGCGRASHATERAPLVDGAPPCVVSPLGVSPAAVVPCQPPIPLPSTSQLPHALLHGYLSPQPRRCP